MALRHQIKPKANCGTEINVIERTLSDRLHIIRPGVLEAADGSYFLALVIFSPFPLTVKHSANYVFR
jgi:hypothetical protein